LAEGVVNKHQCLVVDSEDTFRKKEDWIKFLPNVSKIRDPNEKEEKKSIDPDLEAPEKLVAAWRYNNLLDQKQNAGEIETKPNQAFGRGLQIQYKFDNSKPMGETITNSLS
jgi:hypothetical protein